MINFSKNTKTIISAFSVVILVLAIGATFNVAPNAAAHDPAWNIPTWTYVAVSTDPIGVNQQQLIFMWLNVYPPTANGQYGARWHDLTITVTAPDGNTQTIGPLTSDPVGNAYTPFVPDQLGTYTVQANFPGQTLTDENPNPNGYSRSTEFIGDYFEPSTSRTVTFTVTQEGQTLWDSSAIPTNNFWSRPINAQNREWDSILSDWLGGSAISNKVQPYGIAPNTGHIIWTKPITLGGVNGGQFGDVSYYDGLSYERKFPSPVIISGRLYYNEYPTARYSIDNFPPGFYCVDLATGETLWWKNDTISFGQTYDIENPNQHGTASYLWRTSGRTWHMYDAFNGNDLCTITDVPSGTRVTGSDGSILIYELGPDNSWLACWNSTTAIMYHSIMAGSNYYWDFRPEFGGMYDAANGYDWNVTLNNVPSDAYVMGTDSGILLMTTGLASGPAGVGIGGTPPTYVQCGIDLSSGQTVWQTTRNAAPGNVTITFGTTGEGVYVMRAKETMQWYGYSVTTGEELWGPTDSQAEWDLYGMGGNIAYGTLYSCGYSGILYAYDINSGNLLWTYASGSDSEDVYYGNYPLSVGAIADGKVYLYSTEHSPSKPAWRGSALRAVDAFTGKEIWKVYNWADTPIVADGYIVDLNLYDNKIYCFGKGQTATTVTATPGVGNTVTLQGTVLDQSSGAKDTPAIADQYMDDWMNYLYGQQNCPADATGVPVSLYVTDPNGNTQTISTTSDVSGHYAVSWTPSGQGLYTVTAAFDGTNSYFSSTAVTSISVGEGSANPQVTATPPPVSTPPKAGITETPLVIYLAITIVVIAVTAATALLVRRRK